MADKHNMVKAQLARLDTMDGSALAAKFEELYGFKPCDTTPRHLRRRLATASRRFCSAASRRRIWRHWSA